MNWQELEIVNKIKMQSNNATFFRVLALPVDIGSLQYSGCEGTERDHLHWLHFKLHEIFVL
jgi:hypothetical protein